MPGLASDSSDRIHQWIIRFMLGMSVVSLLGLVVLQLLPKLPDPGEIAVSAAAGEEKRMIDEQARQLAIRHQDRRTKQTRLAIAGSILFPILAWGYYGDYRQRRQDRLEAEAERQAEPADRDLPSPASENGPPVRTDPVG